MISTVLRVFSVHLRRPHTDEHVLKHVQDAESCACLQAGCCRCQQVHLTQTSCRRCFCQKRRWERNGEQERYSGHQGANELNADAGSVFD